MLVEIRTDTDKYLVKDVLVFGKSWSIEKMFDDAEIQNLVPNGHPKPVPRLQSSKRRGKRRRAYVSTQKCPKEAIGEDNDHREFNPSRTKVWYHSNGPSRTI